MDGNRKITLPVFVEIYRSRDFNVSAHDRPRGGGAVRSFRIVDAVAAWGLVLLGSVHNFVAAPMAYPEVSERMFWFVGAGLSLWYAGAMNLVRQANPTSRTARYASLITNTTLLAYVVAYGVYTGAIGRPEGMVLVGLVAVATLFSALGGLTRKRSETGTSGEA